MPIRPLRPAFATFATCLAVVPMAGALDQPPPASAKTPTTFEVTYDSKIHAGPLSARVYVMLGPSNAGGPPEPRFGPNWFKPEPFYAVEARDWKPGQPLKVGDDAVGYPGPLRELPAGDYKAQAVVRLSPDSHDLGTGEGNAYGPVVTFTVDPKAETVLSLKVDRIVPPRPFEETDRVKLIDVPSPILSAFHKRPIRHRAAVILPEGDLKLKRGTLYVIPGFGGDHHGFARRLRSSRPDFGKDLIRVVLDPGCGTGHHVFADSATNGPRGRALVEELIPYVEKTYPAIADPKARLLNGHSSGGWSSLWLQVTYPDFFGGTWSTSPDPVDFRDFQRINLYAPNANMFRDENGERRPIARRGNTPTLWYDNFSRMEDVIGDGGQLHSFEAVFSPVGPDGKPRPLWDRQTGAVDPEVARSWEPYDIRLVLERNWPTLGPKLKGKIRIVMGDLDTFYLEGATKLLKTSLEALGSDAEVEIVPGRDHGTVIDRALIERFDREMNAAVAAARPEPVPASSR
ncbi:MAG: alpha/beta hydrolase-fold protein [Isosphaeraceae bacterium]